MKFKTFVIGSDLIEVKIDASYDELCELFWSIDRKYWFFTNKNHEFYNSAEWAKFLECFPNRNSKHE